MNEETFCFLFFSFNEDSIIMSPTKGGGNFKTSTPSKTVKKVVEEEQLPNLNDQEESFVQDFIQQPDEYVEQPFKIISCEEVAAEPLETTRVETGSYTTCRLYILSYWPV